MVLLYSQEGRLANRLWQAAHFISNAIENQYKFYHLGFAEFIIYFDESISEELKKYGKNCRIFDFKSSSLKERLLIKYANVSKILGPNCKLQFPLIKQVTIEVSKDEYDISQTSFLSLSYKKIIVADGWLFLDNKALNRQADVIRKILKPNRNFLNNIEYLKDSEFRKYDYVIGVHLRKGDYASFNKGKWLYSNSDYLIFIQRLLELQLFKDKNVGFLLCSDEKISEKDFAGINIIKSTGHFVEDLYLLSYCDFIIGPKSTYSGCASFYGKKPLLHILDKEMKFNELDFKVFGN